MNSFSFLVDLAWVLGLGALITSLFQRLKQPLVLGYLLTGILLGTSFPYFPNLSHPENIQLLAQLGLVFIMFFLGLEFNLRKLKEIGRSALLAGVLELSLVAWLGFILSRLIGFRVSESIFFAAVFCISSTTIIVKSLADEGKFKEDFATLVIGILLVEDVAAVVILVLLSGLASGGSPSFIVAIEAIAKVVAFSAAALGLGLAFVPRFLRWLNRLGGGETLTISAIGISLGLSVMASSFGFSAALGAFLSGAIMAESGIQQKLQERLSSVRDLFLAIFFVTVGLQFEAPHSKGTLLLTGIALITVVVGKIVSNTLASSLVGYDFRTSTRVGLAMAQVGEFSFVIATLGVAARAIPSEFFSVAILVSTLTAFSTPYLIRKGSSWAEKAEASLPEKIRTLLMHYQSWIQALRWPLSRLKLPPSLYPLASRAFLLIFMMAGAVYANRAANTYLAERHLTSVFWENDAKVFRELVFGLVYFSLFLLSLGTLRRLFKHILKASGGKMDPKGQTLLSIAQFVSSFIIGILFLAFASPFVSATTLFLVVVGVVLSKAGLLKHTLSHVETHFDSFVHNIVDSYGMAESSGGAVKLLMKERYPWNASLTDFMLPPTFCAANQTLTELKLRKKTGASVIAVYRGETCIANPVPGFQLLPSDVLVLLGEKEHLESASNYLRECCQAPHPQMEAGGEGFHLDTAQIPAKSILLGKTLKELAFRSHTGASVVGLERGGVRYTTNLPETILQENDVLLLLGNPKEVENARDLVEGKEQPHGLIAAVDPDLVEESFGRG